MKKFAYLIAALATVAIVAPASAETTIINRDGPRNDVRIHRDWHRDGDRTVIIRHHHRHCDY